jgi:hypothetical protein
LFAVLKIVFQRALPSQNGIKNDQVKMKYGIYLSLREVDSESVCPKYINIIPPINIGITISVSKFVCKNKSFKYFAKSNEKMFEILKN